MRTFKRKLVLQYVGAFALRLIMRRLHSVCIQMAASSEMRRQTPIAWIFYVGHFTRAQVGVCGIQFGVCVHSYTAVRHTTHISTLPFGPSTLLEFVSVGSSNVVVVCAWFSSHNFNGFGPPSGFYSWDKCVHWRCINHRLHLRHGLSVWSGSVILSRQIRRNLQCGLSSFSVDGVHTPVRGPVKAGKELVFVFYLDHQVYGKLTVVGVTARSSMVQL